MPLAPEALIGIDSLTIPAMVLYGNAFVLHLPERQPTFRACRELSLCDLAILKYDWALNHRPSDHLACQYSADELVLEEQLCELPQSLAAIS